MLTLITYKFIDLFHLLLFNNLIASVLLILSIIEIFLIALALSFSVIGLISIIKFINIFSAFIIAAVEIIFKTFFVIVPDFSLVDPYTISGPTLRTISILDIFCRKNIKFEIDKKQIREKIFSKNANLFIKHYTPLKFVNWIFAK